MSRAILVKQIARRTGIKNRPRTLRQTAKVMIPDGTRYSPASRKVLSQVKALTRRDGNDRQIDLVEIREMAGGRHSIKSRVLYRVYKSESDGQVYVYQGESQRRIRWGKPAGTIDAKLGKRVG